VKPQPPLSVSVGFRTREAPAPQAEPPSKAQRCITILRFYGDSHLWNLRDVAFFEHAAAVVLVVNFARVPIRWQQGVDHTTFGVQLDVTGPDEAGSYSIHLMFSEQNPIIASPAIVKTLEKGSEEGSVRATCSEVAWKVVRTASASLPTCCFTKVTRCWCNRIRPSLLLHALGMVKYQHVIGSDSHCTSECRLYQPTHLR
jgi:hypothetical protein